MIVEREAATVSSGDVTITSGHDTPEEMAAVLGLPAATPKPDGTAEPAAEAAKADGAPPATPSPETPLKGAGEVAAKPEKPEEPPDADAEDLEEATPGKPKLSGAQRAKLRIHKLEQERDLLLAKLTEKAPVDATKTPHEKEAKPAPPVDDGRPKPPNEDDFETRAEFRAAELKWIEDLTDWKSERAVKTVKAQQEQAKIREEVAAQERAFTASVAPAKAAHKDYDAVVQSVDEHLENAGVTFPPELQYAILTSDAGAELYYALAKDNAKDLVRLCALDAVGAAREIGRIEARLEKPSTETAKKPEPKPRAPEPISPLGSIAAAGVEPDLETSSFDSFCDIRSKQIQAKGGRR